MLYGSADMDPGPGVYNVTGGSSIASSGFILKLCQSQPSVSITASAVTACIGDTITLAVSPVTNGKYQWYTNGTAFTADTLNILKVATSGTYIVSAGSGCAGYDTMSVTFLPVTNPFIALNGATLSVNVGSQVNIPAQVVNGGTGYSIDWYRNGTLLITTSTNNLSYTKTSGTDTIIAVIYKQGNPCYRPDTSNARIVSEVNGVKDQIAANAVVVYPNPSSATFSVSSSLTVRQIDIMELTGKHVQTLIPNANRATIDLSGKASGVYFYTLVLEGDKILRGKILLAK